MHARSLTQLTAVFAALVALTALTIGLSFFDLGRAHIPLGLTIAALKAALVALYFMELIESPRLYSLAVVAGVCWLAILLGLTLSDYVTRRPKTQNANVAKNARASGIGPFSGLVAQSADKGDAQKQYR